MVFNSLKILVTSLAIASLLSTNQVTVVHATQLAGSPQQQTQIPPSQEGTVSIQPSVGRSSTGAPLVIVSVDKNRVRIGEMVRFTITPAGVVINPKYRVSIDFGDGVRRQIDRPEVTYRYRAKGHYTVYASALPDKSIVGPPDTVNLQIPRVSLSAAPTPVTAGQIVSFTAQIDSQYPNLKYRFSFGDGAQTSWQDSPAATHAYQAPGTYLAYVDIGAGSGSAVRRLGGSPRRSIGVISIPLGPVELFVNPSPVDAGQPVTLTARLNATDSNFRYRFTFGDGTQGGWQVGPQTVHVYPTAGSFGAYVEVGRSSNRGIQPLGSAGRPVQVLSKTPPSSVSVSLNANPTSVQPGALVTFDARVTGNTSNLKYRFVYGEGSSSSGWQDSRQVTHKYSGTGNYSAFVEVGRTSGGRLAVIATSGPRQINVSTTGVVSPSPSPSPTATVSASPSPGSSIAIGDASPAASPGLSLWPLEEDFKRNWWVYLLIALLLLFAAYKLWQWIAGPRPSVRAFADTGEGEVIAGAKGLAIDSEVILRPNISEGEYLIHTDDPNLVKKLRRENV